MGAKNRRKSSAGHGHGGHGHGGAGTLANVKREEAAAAIRAAVAPPTAGGAPRTRMEILRKALKPAAGWNKETFEEFYDVVYWFRQLLAVVVGIVWGRAGSRGAPAIVSFVGLNIMLPRAYYARYAQVDEDDFDALELLKEGFQPSFGVFMITWILAYNYFQQDKLAPQV